MEYTIDRIKIDLQTVGFSETEELLATVEKELRRVLRFRNDVVAADIYLREEGTNPANNKQVRWRLGIPGNDLFAEGTGNSWAAGLRDAGDKLRRQFVD
ncbi:HPF/RaiA family ribosome-associated protein [Spirosoma montaniterrae]|uniref:30S ribosomal protein S30 n=1 Tax=Spirosoma montaniterrae TaxID=1178516 RepID=A0A1P9WXF8_9BACT|nr:HPF/RaiA family ribosome-associated protein [Spirosoma montaniterrae]AQG80065.1 hypothetical protein AWR27_12455 [Spirosoma montaniterrae]